MSALAKPNHQLTTSHWSLLLSGFLDDVSIYARALSHIEVVELMDNPTGRYEYHHTNAPGSNIVLTDEGKNVIARYEYDVFGAVRSEVGTSDNPRKFTGKEWESDVKLYYFAARYYDPHIGRFTQRDPIGDGINWYAYAYNNPLAFIDPLGLRPVNDREEYALTWTFGEGVSGFLASVIDVQVEALPGSVAGTVRGSSTIVMAAPYDPEDLDNLTTFIHEATHVWQNWTGLHNEVGDGTRDYTWVQVNTGNLNREEHAEAVEAWFYVTYGLAHGMLVNPQVGWARVAGNYNPNGGNVDIRNLLDSNGNGIVERGDSIIWDWPWNTFWFLDFVVRANYASVINKIRNESHLPILLQNYPNPAQ